MPSNLIPPLAPALDVFGTVATYTPIGGFPTACTVIDTGRPPVPAVGNLHMSAVAEVDLRKVIAVAVADIPLCKVGDVVEVALDSRGLRAWHVDRVDDTRADEFRLVVS